MRDPVALFEVNPGIGTPEVSGSWPQSVGGDDFPRRTKIAAPRGLRCRSSRQTMRPVRRLLVHRQGRDGRDLVNGKGNIMPNIGTFTKPEDGFVGTMRTLAFNVKVKIVPVAKDNDKGPDYRVIAGAMEIGAAWIPQATRAAGRRGLALGATSYRCDVIDADRRGCRTCRT